jgi:hypothetical protein
MLVAQYVGIKIGQHESGSRRESPGVARSEFYGTYVGGSARVIPNSKAKLLDQVREVNDVLFDDHCFGFDDGDVCIEAARVDAVARIRTANAETIMRFQWLKAVSVGATCQGR